MDFPDAIQLDGSTVLIHHHGLTDIRTGTTRVYRLPTATGNLWRSGSWINYLRVGSQTAPVTSLLD